MTVDQHEELDAEPNRGSERPTRGARASGVTAAVTLVVLTLALGFVDGTGLFTPENGVDTGWLPTWATSPAWATVVFLPLLVIGVGVVTYRVVAGLRTGAPTRWVWWAAWSAVALVAPLAKLGYSALLLAVAGFHGLVFVPTLRAVLAAIGLSAAKYAVLGLIVATTAAVAYRLARGPGIQTAAPAKVRSAWSWPWFLLGAAVAAWAVPSTSAWVEGSWLPLVMTAGGFVGAYLLTRVTWSRLTRQLDRHGTLALSATTVIASGIGFLLPWLIDSVGHGLGGGLFPVVGVIFHIGAGALAGLVTVALGLLGSLVQPRGWTRVVGPVVAVALAIGLAAAPARVTTGEPYPVPSAPSADSGGLLALTVGQNGAPVIADAAGRQVLLRGVNVNQLVDYGQRDASQPTVRPLTDRDYAQMANRYGFDVQRLNLSWSALEPTRGQIDQSYLQRVRTAVDQAAAHGIYTVLDMHQDTYSKYVTAKPGTKCRIGAEPEFGNDGAPQWATLTDGFPGCGFQGRDLSPNVEQAFTNLYDDRDNLGSAFAFAWSELAREFAGNTAVAGYDLLNEPGPGNAPGITSSILLGRLYQQSIDAIRAAEASAPGGYHHLVFFEPSILWSGLGFDVTPPVGFSHDPALVFSPHLYSQSITMDQGLGITLTTVDHGYDTAARAAAAYDVPLWSGEWGWFGDLNAAKDRYVTFFDQQNARMLGSAVWVWKKACGDPQTGAADTVTDGLNRVACPSGHPVVSPAFERVMLSQAYPRAAPGRLSSLSSSATSRDLHLAGSGTGELDVWVPGSTRPTVTVTDLTGTTLKRSGTGWRLAAQAAGSYALAVH